jgi:hypothetical protein
METIMFGTHPTILRDLGTVKQAERLASMEQARLIHSATGGVKTGLVRSMRQTVGAIVIATGHWIHGERAAIETQTGSGSLRMAR